VLGGQEAWTPTMI